MGQKLFKFNHKLNRQEKRIQNSIVGYSFGDSEILLEITPKKEVQISIDCESPDKLPKILNFEVDENDEYICPTPDRRVSDGIDSQIRKIPSPKNSSESLRFNPVINEPDKGDTFGKVSTNLAKNHPIARKSSLKTFRRYDSL